MNLALIGDQGLCELVDDEYKCLRYLSEVVFNAAVLLSAQDLTSGCH